MYGNVKVLRVAKTWMARWHNYSCFVYQPNFAKDQKENDDKIDYLLRGRMLLHRCMYTKCD